MLTPNNLGPAAVSGLLADDIMIEIQGITLTSVNQALDIVAESVPDTSVQIVIERRGQRMIIPTRIGTRLDTE